MQPAKLDGSSKARSLGSGDPLADAVSLLRPSRTQRVGLHARGSWALKFDPVPHVVIGVIALGECWLIREGRDPLLLRAEDFYLLSKSPSYVLASDLEAVPTEAGALCQDDRDGTLHVGPTGALETYVCSVELAFDQDEAFLTDPLPRLVHVRAGDKRGDLLAHLSAILIREDSRPGVGSALVMDHLAQLLLLHTLRAHADQADSLPGWLAALSGDGIAAALRALHSDIAHRWTLDELATVSRMSRSAFASAFKRRVGVPPLSYLIEWRMRLARDALRRDTCSISQLAAATGYESESAFSNSFRRVVGVSPRNYREQVRSR